MESRWSFHSASTVCSSTSFSRWRSTGGVNVCSFCVVGGAARCSRTSCSSCSRVRSRFSSSVNGEAQVEGLEQRRRRALFQSHSSGAVSRLAYWPTMAGGDVLGHLRDVVLEVVARQDVAAPAVDDLALLIHHVVVFEQMLADVEVVAFDLALRVGDGAGDQAVLDRHAFFHAEAGHQALDAFGAEDAQQVVLERQKEARCAGVALAAGAAAQLVVDAAALVALRAHDVQAAGGDDLARAPRRTAACTSRGCSS